VLIAFLVLSDRSDETHKLDNAMDELMRRMGKGHNWMLPSARLTLHVRAELLSRCFRFARHRAHVGVLFDSSQEIAGFVLDTFGSLSPVSDGEEQCVLAPRSNVVLTFSFYSCLV
jgi:hypothetical protein